MSVLANNVITVDTAALQAVSRIQVEASPVQQLLSVAPSEGAIMAAPGGAGAPVVDGSEGARSL